MGRIQSSVGLVTGLQIEDTVKQLMALAAQPRDTLALRQKAVQAQQAAVTDLTALVLGVQLAIGRFKTSTLFDTKAVTSSHPDLLTATASAEVPNGQYQFIPYRLAQTHQLLSSGVAARDQALGAGSLTIRYGGHVNQAASLDDLNAGAGVARGKIKITDRNGASAVIDLAGTQTIDDVLSAINGSDDIDVEASAVGDRIRLVDSSGGALNLRVQEVSGGTAAADLGLGGINVAASQVDGQDIVQLFEGLSLDQLNDGAGIGLRPELPELELTFRDGSTLSLDLDPTGQTAPRTLGDILARLNAADPGRLQAAISADGDRIELTDLTGGGGTFSVANSLGGNVAEELGLTAAAVGGTLAGNRIFSGLKTTLLGSLGGGTGLGALGGLSLTDRSGATAVVDLSGAQTLDDVISAINAAGLDIQADYNAARSGLQLTDTSGATVSNLIASDADATGTATKLGLTASVADNEINGSSLARQTVSRNTRLDSYNGGQGVGTGSFLITDSSGVSGAVNLATLQAETIGDVIDAINSLPAGVEARINDAGDGLILIDTAGGTGRLNVTQVGSGTAAKDLGILGQAEDVVIGGQTVQALDGSTTFTVTIDADDTLDDLVTKINALGANVTAGVLTAGSGSLRHHLTLLSGQSGKAGELLVDGSGAGLTFADLASAQDAVLQYGTGLAAIRYSSDDNQFDDVVEGLDITLTGQSLERVTVNVDQTSEGAAGALQTLVDNYNKMREKLAAYTALDIEAGTKGTLFGSSEALRIDAELSRLITGRYFGVGEVQSLGELGISLDDKGMLSFDKARFDARYAADPEAVEEFFTDEQMGFAAKADKILERLVGRDSSMLVNRAEVLNRQNEEFTERIEAWDGRLERRRERLLNEFFRLELAVGRIRESLTAISQIQPIAPFTGTAGI
jgi:flagellar hook-associated protein 2